MWLRRSSVGAVVALLPFLAACEARPEPEPEPGQTPVAERARTASAPSALMPVDHSNVTGTALVDQDDEEVSVTLALEGLEPDAAYLAYLHRDRCAGAGSLLTSLGSLTADQAGETTRRVRVPSAEIGAERPWSVQIHTAAGEIVACANILHE
jgi:hypothetical protein